MTFGPWTAGTLITSTATFVSETTGLAADPTTITLKYIAPGATAPTTIVYPNAFITRVTTGIYTAEFDTTALPGTWIVQWQGTGVVQVWGDSLFEITAALL